MSSQVLNTPEEKKKYIRKSWPISSGKRITEMLQRYWNLKPGEPKKPATMDEILEIFEIK